MPITDPTSASTRLSETTRPTTRLRPQPMARSNPNSRVRSNSDRSIVFPTTIAPITRARIVLPVTAAWRNTRLRSARPAWAAVEIVVSWGCRLVSVRCTAPDRAPGSIFTKTSDTDPGTRL